MSRDVAKRAGNDGRCAMAGRAKDGQPSNSVNVRVELETKRALEAAARANGRSLAQEVGRRLEASIAVSGNADIETPTGMLFLSLKNSIEMIESQIKSGWWETSNFATMLEGAIIETASQLVRPFPDQKLYSNRLFKDQERDDPAAQARLREQYLSDGAAVARLATREAFERRAKEYPEPQPDEAETKAKRRREVVGSPK